MTPFADLFARLAAFVGLLVGVAESTLDTAPPDGLAQRTPAEVDRPDAATRVVVLGDSTGEFFARALMGAQVDVVNVGLRKCPLRPTAHTMMLSAAHDFEPAAVVGEGSDRPGTSCGWADYLPTVDVAGAVVVLFAGPMMAVRFDDGQLPDPAFAAVLADELAALADTLDTMGAAQVVAVHGPRSRSFEGSPDVHPYWLDDGIDAAWGDLLAGVDGACFVDYAAYAAARPDVRPDGSHMEGPEATADAVWALAQCGVSL